MFALLHLPNQGRGRTPLGEYPPNPHYPTAIQAAGPTPLELPSLAALLVDALMPTSRIHPCIYSAFRLPRRKISGLSVSYIQFGINEHYGNLNVMKCYY